MLFRPALAAALFLATAPLLAQYAVQPVSEADQLAEQVRRLGANPRDLDALLNAAGLSVRLDDLSAAGAFLARAEKVAPPTARGQAIKAAILVRSERPGEALRLFAQAEAMGASPASFASDRGLAYDLLGEQRRAQADYRVALRAGEDDETRRRLALSLGIAGKQRDALDELAPLVRRNDRGAWRSRAFILAMNGDGAEALTIAQTMMPPGSAQGLGGFFTALPRLPAIDRAFAVHFGEVRATPQRLADARLAPPLAPLPPETAPVQVAAAAPVAAPPPSKRKSKHGSIAVAYAPLPVRAAPVEAVGPPPAYQAPTYAPPVASTPFRAPTVVAANTADRPLTAGEQASLAAATLPSARRRNRAVAPPPVQAASVPTPAPSAPAQVASAPTPAPRAPVLVASAPPSVPRAPARPASAPTPAPLAPVQIAAVAPRPGPVPSPGFDLAQMPAPASALASSEPARTPVTAPASSVAIAPPPPVATSQTAPVAASLVSTTTTFTPRSVEAPNLSAPVAALSPAPIDVATGGPPTPPPVAAAIAPVPRAVAPPRPPRVSRAQADSILAKIVANLSIPASELGIDKPAPGGKPSRAAARLAKAGDAPEESAADKKRADKAAADAKRAADKKALADKKAAAEKKELAAKEAADKKAARAEPKRIWVQVAGGANAGDLAKAWKAAQAKAPGALAGRKGYTTPLRATNRVLTGPFKTDAEARAYVNQLAKSGVSAFSFTSDAGQKVSRLEDQ